MVMKKLSGLFYGVRYGSGKRLYTINSGPINVQEFSDAFKACFTHEKCMPPQSIAIALSGGVDSMVLTHLMCTAKRELWEWHHTRIMAIVVDHARRTESAEEAAWVHDYVTRQYSIPCTVYRLNELACKRNVKDDNFESVARNLRYQALGRLCRDLAYEYVCVAHHSDDQAEQILWRIARNSTWIGLRGMARISNIPCCHGIYAVHASGGSVTDLSLGPGTPCGIEQGNGIRVCRPLLEFSKQRLRDTANAVGLRYTEDSTNAMVTLTVRNTCRWLLASVDSHTRARILPVALTTPNLHAIRKYAVDRYAILQTFARQMLSQCSILNLDTRSGVLTVKFPLTCWHEMHHEPFLLENISVPAYEKLAYMLRSLIFTVTPLAKLDVPTIMPAVKRIFDSTECKPFNLAGVIFKPLSSPIRPTNANYTPTNHSITLWQISREHINRRERIRNRETMVSSQGNPWLLDTVNKIGRFRLFDGRFWIRILYHNNDSDVNVIKYLMDGVYVRFLEEDDLARLYRQLDSPEKISLQRTLAQCAPGKLRWTLPAIIFQLPKSREEYVLGLPSLGWRFKIFHSSHLPFDAAHAKKLSWNCNFRNVDTCEFSISPFLKCGDLGAHEWRSAPVAHPGDAK